MKKPATSKRMSVSNKRPAAKKAKAPAKKKTALKTAGKALGVVAGALLATKAAKALRAKTVASKSAGKSAGLATREPARSKAKIGVLGGAFNPIHAGHLNSAMTVRQKLKLDKVVFMPTRNPPHRQIVGATPEVRLEMINAAIRPYSEEFEVSDLELEREGTSYSVDTLRELNQKYKAENIHFILGADAFAELHSWKDVAEVFTLANFVVTTRPGAELIFKPVPQELKEFVKTSTASKITLNSGKTITRVDLEDYDISATEIRKRLRNNGNTTGMLPPSVTEIIAKQSLYKRTSPLVADYRSFALQSARRLLDKKALGLKVYDMTKINSYADYSIICSATSNRHASSLAEGLVDLVKEETGLTPLSLEGQREGQWVLIDYGAVVVHVFQDSVREQYRIENLWRKCSQIQDEVLDEREKEASTNAGEARNN